jgi:hypothetical protein
MLHRKEVKLHAWKYEYFGQISEHVSIKVSCILGYYTVSFGKMLQRNIAEG